MNFKSMSMAAVAATVLISSAGFAGAAKAEPVTYTLDPAHTNVVWQANHFGFSNPSGKLAKVSGEVTLDEKNPDKSSVHAIINTASNETGSASFNEHLANDKFFNSQKFPTAEFKSTKVELTGKDTAKVTGDLTFLGITKPVILDVKLNKIGENPISKLPTVGFSAKTTVKRSDFGMDYFVATPEKPGVSDDVQISIETEANKQPVMNK